nr:arginine/serine-rich protein PNISR-like isoform X3 [Onthophagus taurus]
MYSGGDSTDAQSYNQWALNPSAYQNMAKEQVDWAALAQQWIIMKEAGPPVPEPPQITPQQGVKPIKKDIEGGEAPMDVENENEEIQSQWNDGTGSGDSWKWQSQQQPPWNWEANWNNPGSSNNTPKPPLLPTPSNFNQYNSNVDNSSDNSNYGYNTTSNYQSGYWTSSGGAKVIKPHNKRYSKVNVPTTVANTSVPPPKVVNLDAAKRKQLPAWIREGLEKMERDKLKQLDREREKQEKAENEAKRKLYEKNALEILKDTVKEQQVKSRFDSGSDESEEDIEGRSLTPEIQTTSQPQRLTQEEMMVWVRRTMTDILLKVTNREIQTICKEELERFERKQKASDQRVSAPSGANLSARLGLGAYGESDSDNSEGNSDDDDSDAQLREEIKRKKAEFVKVERQIEEKLAEAERKRELFNQNRGSPINDNKDTQKILSEIVAFLPQVIPYRKTTIIQNTSHRTPFRHLREVEVGRKIAKSIDQQRKGDDQTTGND